MRERWTLRYHYRSPFLQYHSSEKKGETGKDARRILAACAKEKPVRVVHQSWILSKAILIKLILKCIIKKTQKNSFLQFLLINLIIFHIIICFQMDYFLFVFKLTIFFYCSIKKFLYISQNYCVFTRQKFNHFRRILQRTGLIIARKNYWRNLRCDLGRFFEVFLPKWGDSPNEVISLFSLVLNFFQNIGNDR